MCTALKKALLCGEWEEVQKARVVRSTPRGTMDSHRHNPQPVVYMSPVISCGPDILYVYGAIPGHCISAAVVESTNGIAAESESEKLNECLPSTREGDIPADVGREA